jgi:hypothetical protein
MIDFRAAPPVASEEWIAAVRAIESGRANDNRPAFELPWRSRDPFARLLAAEQWTARLFCAPSMIVLVRDPASRP